MVLELYLNVCSLYCEKPWYYRVCEDYNGVVSKILCDEWVNPRILSAQSLEAHHRAFLSVNNARRFAKFVESFPSRFSPQSEFSEELVGHLSGLVMVYPHS